jgi:hypothetical protein
VAVALNGVRPKDVGELVFVYGTDIPAVSKKTRQPASELARAEGRIRVRLWRGLARQWRRNEDAPGKRFLNGMQEVIHNSGL